MPAEFPEFRRKPQETTLSSTAAPQYSKQNNQRAPEYGSTQQVIETASEARQGVTGHNVRTVLVVSLVAVVIAFAALYAIFFAR